MDSKLLNQPSNFDLFRLNRGSIEVGISHNTLRKYGGQGLNLYKNKMDRAVYVSRRELEEFIKGRSEIVSHA